MMRTKIKKLHWFCLLALLSLTSCGGGGGGGGGGGVACTPMSASFFYEVTQNLTCANSSANNLISSADFSGVYAASDGGSGGGDGGGGSGGGGGGDGGGGGAGDLWMRVISGIKRTVYLALGIRNVQAQATLSACGANVEQSDLNKLAATKWDYQPLVKPGTASGTVCVKRIFDANKYLAVYASNLTKLDQTCYLVLVNKKDGKTRCFSSSESLVLEDEALLSPPTNDFVDYMSPSLYSSPSMSLSESKKYFGVMFHSDGAGNDARQRFVRMTVDSDLDAATTVPSSLLFDSNNLNGKAPWTSATRVFQKQMLLNSGQVVVHYYKASGSKTQTGFTYLSDELLLNEPRKINDTDQAGVEGYTNPQCMLQDPNVNDSFVGVFTINRQAGQQFDLVKLSSNALTAVKKNGPLCNAAVIKDNYFYAADFSYDPYPNSGSSDTYMGVQVKKLNLLANDFNQATTNAFHVASTDAVVDGNQQITCADGRTLTMSVKDQNLNQVTMFLDANGKFIIGARSSIEFDAAAKVVRTSVLAGKGISTLVSVAYDGNTATTTTVLPYSQCKMLRKLEKGTSGYFAYLTEPYDVVTSDNTFIQSTSVRDEVFANVIDVVNTGRPGQFFKLGGMLNPFKP